MFSRRERADDIARRSPDDRRLAVIRTSICLRVGRRSLRTGFAQPANRTERLSVDATPSTALASDGRYISWAEHRIDDELLNGGTAIRGGDGLAMGDIDRDEQKTSPRYTKIRII